MSKKGELQRAARTNNHNAAEQERRALWYIAAGHPAIARDLERNARELRAEAQRQIALAQEL